MPMQIDWNLVLVAAGNLGTVAWVAQRTVTKVEKHGEIIPHLKSLLEEIKKILPDLYERGNVLSDRVTALEQTHQLHGCNVPESKKRRATTRKRRTT